MSLNRGMYRISAMLVPLLLLVLATSCAVQSRSETQARQNNGVIVLESDVDATAIIDGGLTRALPAGAEVPVPVKPGQRRVEIVSEGHLPRRFDVDVEANEAVIIEVQMWPSVEELDDPE